MTNDPQPELIIIESLDEIPSSFADEDEEREWWATHQFSDVLYEQLEDTTAELDEIMPLSKPEKSKRQ